MPLLLTACVPDPVSVALNGSRPVLVAIVVAGAPTVSFALGASAPGGYAPERGATLTLVTPTGPVNLEERPDDDCGAAEGYACYVGAPDTPIRPGDTLSLAGRFADGSEIRGEAVVPLPPSLVFEDGPPVPDTVRVDDGSILRITVAGGYPGAVMALDSLHGATVWTPTDRVHCVAWNRLSPQDLRLAHRLGVGADALVCPPDGLPPTAWDSMAVTIPILGYGPSATGFLSAAPEIFATEAGWGVDGAWGVFGAAAPRVLTLVTRNRPQ